MTGPIRVSKYVMGRLRSLAVNRSESYDHIINRLLDSKVGVNRFDYLVFNDDCCVRLFVDWDVCSPVIQYYSENVLVDEFPVDCCFDDGLWSEFRDCVFGVPDLMGVLALLDCDDVTVVDGLTIVCMG